MKLTDKQKEWLEANPEFGPCGPPRPVKFHEWGNLYPDGTYERIDNARMKAIRLPCLAVGRRALEGQP